MKIEKVKQYDPRIGWHILIKEFSKSDLKKLNVLLLKMGMMKNRIYKKRGKELLKKTLKDYLHKKYPSKIKRNLIRAKWILMKIRDPKIIERTFTNKVHFFDYSYLASEKLFTSNWKSKNMDGEEFISMFLSEIQYEN